uniref:Uncharacterized protein n=1 Tax=Arundo donax TaxID=35708 RepID=A0A0A8YJI3_ARUDO
MHGKQHYLNPWLFSKHLLGSSKVNKRNIHTHLNLQGTFACCPCIACHFHMMSCKIAKRARQQDAKLPDVAPHSCKNICPKYGLKPVTCIQFAMFTCCHLFLSSKPFILFFQLRFIIVRLNR